ncbi:hypothetical protein QOT17_010410 [Balamuthia mandrillaris]
MLYRQGKHLLLAFDKPFLAAVPSEDTSAKESFVEGPAQSKAALEATTKLHSPSTSATQTKRPSLASHTDKDKLMKELSMLEKAPQVTPKRLLPLLEFCFQLKQQHANKSKANLPLDIGEREQILQRVARLLPEKLSAGSVFSLTTLISLLGKNDRLDDALLVYTRMREDYKNSSAASLQSIVSLPPSSSPSSSISLTTTTSTDPTSTPQKQQSRVKPLSVRPNVITYSALIDSCVQNKRLNTALELFQQMTADGLMGTTDNNDDNKYDQLHKTTSTNLTSLEQEQRMAEESKPEVYLMTNLINGCIRQNKLEVALQLFARMQSNDGGLPSPNTHTYGSIIAGLVKEGRLAKAEELFFEELRRNPHRFVFMPDAVASLASSTKKQPTQQELLQDIKWFIEAYEGNKTKPEKRELVEPPHTVMLNSVINGYRKKHNYTQALAVYRQASNVQGLFFSQSTYNILITCCSRANHLQALQEVVASMKKDGFRLDELAYHCLVRVYPAGSRDFPNTEAS